MQDITHLPGSEPPILPTVKPAPDGPVNFMAGIALSIIVLQLPFAALLVALEQVGSGFRDGQPGLYYSVLAGLLFASWGLAWRRLWTIPVAFCVACGLVCWIMATHAWGNQGLGPMSGLQWLLAQAGILIFVSLIGLQILSIAIVARTATSPQKNKHRWPHRLVPLCEVAILLVAVPLLYGLDFVLPREQHGRNEARRAARDAQENEEYRQKLLPQRQAFERFAAAVEAGQEDAKLAAWSELIEIDRKHHLQVDEEFARHPNRQVRGELLDLAIQASLADGDWRLYSFSKTVLQSDPNLQLRLRVVQYLLDSYDLPTGYMGAPDKELESLFKECLPFFGTILADRSAENAARRANVAKVIGSQRRYAENFLPLLTRINQSDSDPSVQQAAMAAIGKIEKDIEVERRTVPYYGPQGRIELPKSLTF